MPQPTRSRRTAREEGTTLVELLVAISILGIVVVAMVGGMGTAIIGTDINRKQAVTHTVIVSAAESVKSGAYVACANPSDYSGYLSGVSVPDGWGSSMSVESVQYWNGTTFVNSCPGTDQKLQLVHIRVIAPTGRGNDTVAIVKRNAS